MQPAVTVEGKVVELKERDGVHNALVRFTGVDWDTQARIETFAATISAVADARPPTARG
jgi:hypothetical protein